MAGTYRRLLLLSALLALTFTQRAVAQTVDVVAVERGPGAEECPDAAALNARVAAIRGRASSANEPGYDVSFARAPDSITATIRGRPNGESQRVLEAHGQSCAALARATAVTLALLFDSTAEAASARPADEAPKPPPLPPKPVLLAEPILIPVHEPSRERRSSLTVGISGLVGVLRPLSPALTAELGLGVARVRMSLGVLWNPTQSLPLGPGVVRESLLSGTARGCFELGRSGNAHFDVCSGLFAGVATADAAGFTTSQRRARTWLAVPVELLVAERFGAIGWEASAAALGSLVHPDFSIDHLGPAYQAPRVGAMLSLRVSGLLRW